MVKIRHFREFSHLRIFAFYTFLLILATTLTSRSPSACGPASRHWGSDRRRLELKSDAITFSKQECAKTRCWSDIRYDADTVVVAAGTPLCWRPARWGGRGEASCDGHCFAHDRSPGRVATAACRPAPATVDATPSDYFGGRDWRAGCSEWRATTTDFWRETTTTTNRGMFQLQIEYLIIISQFKRDILFVPGSDFSTRDIDVVCVTTDVRTEDFAF